MNIDALTTDEKILLAIGKLLNMETYNSVKKADIITEFRWFFDYVMEVSLKEGDDLSIK